MKLSITSFEIVFICSWQTLKHFVWIMLWLTLSLYHWFWKSTISTTSMTTMKSQKINIFCRKSQTEEEWDYTTREMKDFSEKKILNTFFIIAAQVNKNCYEKTLSDSECNIYVIVNRTFSYKNNLTCIKIDQKNISKFKSNHFIVDHVTLFSLNIDKNYQQTIWAYKIWNLKHKDIVFKILWMYEQQIIILFDFKLKFLNIELKISIKTFSLNLHHINAHSFHMQI